MQKLLQKLKAIKKALSKKRRDFMATRPHRSFRPTKTPFKKRPLAGITQNLLGSFKTIWQERRLLLVMALIYMVVTYVFVGGVAQADFVELKEATLQVFGGSVSSFGTVVSLLTSTMTGAFNSELSELQQFLGLFLVVFFWLSIIWALRMRFAEQTIKARDAIYNAGAPLAAFIVVTLFIMLQLMPGGAGIFIFTAAQAGGYLHGGVEVMLFAAAAFLLSCLSVYWLAGSLTALVVATLPNMYPWRAIQIAGELVVGRRLRMLGHMGVLAITLVLVWIVGLLPIMLIDSWLRLDWLPLVPVMVQTLSAFTALYAATYLYKLYRSML